MLIEAGNQPAAQPCRTHTASRTAARIDDALDGRCSKEPARPPWTTAMASKRRPAGNVRRQIARACPAPSWLSCDALATWAADAVRAGEAA